MKIYHNPRCSKSRETLKILTDKGIQPEIVEYLKNIPTEEELDDLIIKLNIKPEQLVRKTEAIYKEKFKGQSFNDHEWVKIMIEYPQLIERPIVVSGYKAVIGRPPSLVLDLMN